MANTTGIVRKLDNLGRAVIPIEMRRTLGIEERDRVDISLRNGAIILRKIEEQDIFTGNISDDLIEFQGKMISKETIKKLAELLATS
jgi:transcriptional pleiotropic regulator of transition state genes